MKAMLLRVGMDKGTDGFLSPLFKDGSFEYLPLSEKISDSFEQRTFHDLMGHKGKPLSYFLPTKISLRKVHHDPEFITYTYADEGRKGQYLRKLIKNDYLVFYAGLHPYKWLGKDKLYIIGYLVVSKIIEFRGLSPKEIKDLRQQYTHNSHLKRSNLEEVVLVTGNTEKSKLLNRAMVLSEYKIDKRGRRYHAVSPLNEELLGISGSIQRSIPPRFIKEKKYLRNLIEILQK
jgi:hypothetical protein